MKFNTTTTLMLHSQNPNNYTNISCINTSGKNKQDTHAAEKAYWYITDIQRPHLHVLNQKIVEIIELINLHHPWYIV